MWVRGLKPPRRSYVSRLRVAPYVGAWIETTILKVLRRYSLVAPYVGAWIETPAQNSQLAVLLSHPMWVRGLKPFHPTAVNRLGLSHPMWVRGLKHSRFAP